MSVDQVAKAKLEGYSLPQTETGRSSLVPPPPWHYSGDFLIVEYRAEPEAARALLPPELDPGPDIGAAAAIFVDWQSCSDSFEELLDPVRAQYKEFFVVLSAEHRGEAVTRCPFMWVDQGMPLVRGLIQGFPKKPGSIWMTKPVTVGKAGPRLAPGGRFGATLAAADRRLAEATRDAQRRVDGGSDRQLASAPQHALFPGMGEGREAARRARLGGRRRPRDLDDLGR